MCDKCFQRLIFKFDTYKDFANFESIMQEKYTEGHLQAIEDINSILEVEPNKFYKCRNCGEVWVLSIPKNTWRGYFLTQEEAIDYQDLIKNRKRKKQVGCFVFLIIATLVIIIWNLIA